MAPVRMLVTGFDAFPGIPDNPTATLAEWLGRSGQAGDRPNLDLIVSVLPVDWETTPRLLADMIERYDPDVTLHFGASRRAAGFRIEQWARNRTGFAPDAAGRKAARPQVLPGAPRALRAQLPAVPLALGLRALGLPCVASTDAGRYLCNAVYYLALAQAARGGRPRVCQFVHVPAALNPGQGDSATLSWAGLRRGALALVDHLERAGRGARTQAKRATTELPPAKGMRL